MKNGVKQVYASEAHRADGVSVICLRQSGKQSFFLEPQISPVLERDFERDLNRSGSRI